MKFCVIAQDLKVSGTSEGIVSRSFLFRLREAYPEAKISVLYFRNMPGEDELNLLPVDEIKEVWVRRSPLRIVKLVNHLYWRMYKFPLNEEYIIHQYRRHLKRIDGEKYDYIFIRSAGNNFETILSCKDLPLLRKAIINFHDPYPQFWDSGTDFSPSGLELNRLKRMWKVVQQAKACITPSQSLSRDMEFLYGSKKKFYTLPHQFTPAVFRSSTSEENPGSRKKIVISYQGAVQLGRNLEILLDAYLELLKKQRSFRETTQFLLRITGPYSEKLIKKYQHQPNLIFLEQIPFAESLREMKNETDILVILENCTGRSNILPGKVPVIASLKKPVLCLSPKKSEMRRLLDEPAYVASCDNREEIMQKLEKLIISVSQEKEFKEDPFRGYFNEKNFNKRLKAILRDGNSF